METFEDDRQEREADRMIAATLYLMSCHARNRCPRIACMVEHHLRCLGRHAGAGEHVRELSRRLSAAWVAVRKHDERSGPRPDPAQSLH